MNKKAYGFTIVELLIVIIIIGILAAISTIAYTNFQQRAKNTAIINAANQSLKALQAYIAMEGVYPVKWWAVCITSDSGCSISPGSDETISANATFDTNMAKVGSLPKSVPMESGRLYGVTYIYDGAVTFDGVSQPAMIRYFLFGQNQKCGVPNVMHWTADNTFIPSTSGYTSGNSGGNSNRTGCYILVPGPAHS